MKLSTLEKYNEIVIQMHDNPDADAVGSGYAIYKYFEEKGKNVRLVYSGSLKITKSNILLLIESLNLPVEYVTDIGNPELLITVDCQYGEGNVKKFEAKNVAIIDHHNTGRESDEMSEVRSHLVSCSTVCYDLLKKEGMRVNNDVSVSTALYYGLYMDSNGFSELRHPLEREMIDYLRVDKALVKRLVHSNFTIQELETAGIALIRYSYDEHKRISIIKAKPCDPNILGIIGDLVLQVDTIDVSIIYNECQGGYKLSIRSCVIDVAANDLAVFLTEQIGNGGGHNDKAGGFISAKRFSKVYGEFGIEAYFFDRVGKYYENYNIIRNKKDIEGIEEFKLYVKKQVECGFVKSMDLAKEGTECKIRTFEGDVYINTSPDIYIMIGYFGEVYPIERKVFEKKYSEVDNEFNKHFEYDPSVRNLDIDEEYNLMEYARTCICKEDSRIYAKPLYKPTKVFTRWDYDKYMIGNVGDYICYVEDDENDIYILNREVFKGTYDEV